MRNFVKGVVAALVLVVAYAALSVPITDPVAGTVAADVFAPAGTGDSGAVRTAPKGVVLYDSGIVAGGAEILSPLLDVRGFSSLSLLVYNADISATRVLGVQNYLLDGTTAIPSAGFVTAHTVPANANTFTTWSPAAATSNVLSAMPVKASFRLASGGAANGRMVVLAR